MKSSLDFGVDEDFLQFSASANRRETDALRRRTMQFNQKNYRDVDFFLKVALVE